MIVAMTTAAVTGAMTMPTIVGAMKTMAAVIVAAMTTNELVSRVDAPREGEGDHRTEQARAKSGAERFHGGRELLQGPCCCARDERRRSWINYGVAGRRTACDMLVCTGVRKESARNQCVTLC